MGRKMKPEAITKQLETKKARGIYLVPAHLQKYNQKLRAHGYKSAERRKFIAEALQQ